MQYQIGQLPSKSKQSSLSSTIYRASKNVQSQVSSQKIYVPIEAQQQKSQKNIPSSQSSFIDHNNLIMSLKKSNAELREKEEIYIDKLMKLQEGLEKQHLEYLQLQDLYNQLFISYKNKEEEFAELQILYRESSRKRESVNLESLKKSSILYEEEKSRKIDEQKDRQLQKLAQVNEELNRKIKEVNEKISNLTIENNYLRNKEKMNDSRASLHSKVFEELDQYQKMVDEEREQKIQIQYENQFFKNRNEDLEQRVKELEEILKAKQNQLMKMRQNNIILHRENSESKLFRSISRSPKKGNNTSMEDHQSNKKSLRSSSLNKGTLIIDELYEENKNLKIENEKLKNVLTLNNNNSSVEQKQRNVRKNNDKYNEKNSYRNQNLMKIDKIFDKNKENYSQVKEEEFFSFSQEENTQKIESSFEFKGRANLKNLHDKGLQRSHQEMLIQESKKSEADSLEGQRNVHISYDSFSHEKEEEEVYTPPRFASPSSDTKQKSINSVDDELQDLPPALEIDSLIERSRGKLSNSKAQQSP